jgi:hypothetical protein
VVVVGVTGEEGGPDQTNKKNFTITAATTVCAITNRRTEKGSEKKK